MKLQKKFNIQERLFFSAPFPSDLHLSLWPRKVVILFCNVFLIPPDDPLGKVFWAFMGQVPPVVVVPIEIWGMAFGIPPSPKVGYGAISVPYVIIPVFCCESITIESWQRVFESRSIRVISRDAEIVQRTRLHLETVIECDVRLVLEILQLHHQLPGAMTCDVGNGLQAQPVFCGNLVQ